MSVQYISDIVIITECYANAGFADALMIILNREISSHNLSDKIHIKSIYHTPKQGIDVVLKRSIRALCQHTCCIVVIDYEQGEMRRYVNKILTRELSKFDNIVVRVSQTFCSSSHTRYLIGIVFDPRIEEALICKISSEFCKDLKKKRLIKSYRGREVVKNLVSKKCSNLLGKLVRLLLDIIRDLLLT
ncbi:MAG: hypothetical protein GXO10_03865 [Crenarchaeota archaeon]|nr:hypothetical protein [Thermoproteota archaeon]